MNNSRKEQWNQFVIENKGSFLQSWQWGQLQEAIKRKIWRIETKGLKGLIIKHNLIKSKNYLYCPRGPIGQGDFREFLNKIKEIAKQEKSIFFKIEPDNKDRPLDTVLETRTVSKGQSLFKSTKEIQPSQTIVLDISRPEDELLKQMHSKARYNIRLAQKKEIEIKQSHNQELIAVFIDLLEKTAKRDKFYLHPKEYYHKILNILGEQGTAKLFLAYYQNKVIAANLIYFFGQTAVYAHGASDYDYRQLMAPYLLQWRAICQAKQQGFKYYDFNGIDDKKWPGVTRFKKGFGGQEMSYSGAFDLVFNRFWYFGYKIVRKIM